MRGKVYYRPCSGAKSPFASSGEAGTGPSARGWGKEHLNWLHVDFSDEWPLYSCGTPTPKEGLLDESLAPGVNNTIIPGVKKELGLAWSHIRDYQGSAFHYSKLRDLGTARSLIGNREAYFATSSPFSSSEVKACPRQSNYADFDIRSSPPLPATPAQQAQVDVGHDMRQCTDTTTSANVPSSRHNNIPLTPSNMIARTGSSTPIYDPVTYLHQTTVGTPKAQQLDCDAWAASCTTDSTYKNESTPKGTPRMTEDKRESHVASAVEACLDVLKQILQGFPHKLSVEVEPPDPLCTVVEGYRCSCTPDMMFRVGFREQLEQHGKYGVVYGEVRTFEF